MSDSDEYFDDDITADDYAEELCMANELVAEAVDGLLTAIYEGLDLMEAVPREYWSAKQISLAGMLQDCVMKKLLKEWSKRLHKMT